ncbi:MAG: alanine--glyoxylate aminotransferase family protein [Dehalococcoidia bacterium]|nr:alanine--glyoxylate aminotransferase family protein [Dehalococcoidia bacterium]MDW8119212.1 alanine--glyoxylate aminotransferase family protein [Chloroflexota bacterium]
MANLRVPGPTPCPEDVLAAVGRQMINHRGPEFKDLITRIHQRLQQVFQTTNDVLIFTASGTGAMEACLVNTLSPGDQVLCVSIGEFGERFIQIAEAYGMQVVKVAFPYGQAADPDQVRKALKAHPQVKAVCITHNETSTGVTNDLQTLAQVVKEADKLLIVDAISSLGCIPLPVDAWGCDVVATASQKGFMVPPGLAFVSVSPRAWEAYKTAKAPRFYLDFGKHKSYYERGQTPWTPAVSIFYGLDVSLAFMLQQGMENIYAHHARMGALTRQGARALGLSLLVADERYASNTVTAIKVPEGVDGRRLEATLREKFGVVVAGGQGPLAGKIIRIGHMGYVRESDIRECLDAVGKALLSLGYRVPTVTRAV